MNEGRNSSLQFGSVGYIPIGGIKVTKAPGKLATLLGSCVALVVYDRETGTGGLSHILLSGDGTIDRTKLSDPAVKRLISEVKKVAGQNTRLEAKIVGGALLHGGISSMLCDIGRNTALRVMELLVERRIDITGMHIGGTCKREIVFDLDTGKMHLKIDNACKTGKLEITL